MEARLVDLVENMCHQQGDQVALLDETTKDSLTYCDLPEKFYKISDVLKSVLNYEKSKTNPPFVSIISNRHIGSVVSVLGVMSANAAFVPIDPALPEEFQTRIFRHSKSQLIIVDQDNIYKVRRMFPQPPPLIVIDWYGCVKEVSHTQVYDNHASSATKKDPILYLLYKNAEIGEKANGVMLLNQGIVNTLKYFVAYLRLREDDRVLSLMPLACDASIIEIFMPLIVGGTLIIAAHVTTEEPRRLMQVLRQYEVTFLQCTRDLAEELVDEDWKGDKELQLMVATGDVDNRTLTPKIYSLIPKCRQIYVVYGSTESSVWASCHWLESFDRDAACLLGAVPQKYQNNVQYSYYLLGQPIYNQSFFVLGANMQPVKPGQIGELYIGGKGVAKGYYCNAEHTKQRFLKNSGSSSGDSAGKLFKTGKFCLKVRSPENHWEYVAITGIDQLPSDLFHTTLEWCQAVGSEFVRNLLPSTITALASPSKRSSSVAPLSPQTTDVLPKGNVSSFTSVTTVATDHSSAPQNGATSPQKTDPIGDSVATPSSSKPAATKSRRLSRKGSLVTPAGHYFYCQNQLDSLIASWDEGDQQNEGASPVTGEKKSPLVVTEQNDSPAPALAPTGIPRRNSSISSAKNSPLTHLPPRQLSQKITQMIFE